MSKTNKTIVALVVIVLLLIVGYMFLGNSATTEPTTEVEGEVQGVETQATDEVTEEGADITEVVVEGDVVVEGPIAE